VDLTPDGYAEKLDGLNNLGISYSRRFKRAGDLVDNDKAISANERAANLIPDGNARLVI
jgi:hypothetical protein